MSSEELSQESQGVETLAPMDIGKERVMGTPGAPDYDSSPDVAMDGSLAGDATAKAEAASWKPGMRGLRAIYYKIRALILAPIGLLRHYLQPILAFILVFGGFLYLLYLLS